MDSGVQSSADGPSQGRDNVTACAVTGHPETECEDQTLSGHGYCVIAVSEGNTVMAIIWMLRRVTHHSNAYLALTLRGVNNIH